MAIQQRKYNVAECILRDLSLKEAVQNGIMHDYRAPMITLKDDVPTLRRQNSFTFDNENGLEVCQ